MSESGGRTGERMSGLCMSEAASAAAADDDRGVCGCVWIEINK